MYPSQFAYHRAGSVDEAITLLNATEGAKLIAGGHSLLPLMKLRLLEPTALIDIARIPGLNHVSVNGGATVGALTTYRQLMDAPGLAAAYPALVEAASIVGDIQVRNRGTIGGAVAHADPAADLPAVMLAYEASFTAIGAGGKRTIPASEFFVDLLTTALEAGEVLTQITLPALPTGAGSAYVKFPHPASGYAIVGVAAVVGVASGVVRSARVAVTGAGAKAVRLSGVERAITGQPVSATEAAATSAADGLDLSSDIHASATYRAHLVRVFTRRALDAAIARAQG
ncbi:MAG: xanthine dehydrogenase family protein subunit M [Chloroflexi bacterium]|nr:xanthine dehydrogenase family protein subunit M [Chloroflexota bacterium]